MTYVEVERAKQCGFRKMNEAFLMCSVITSRGSCCYVIDSGMLEKMNAHGRKKERLTKRKLQTQSSNQQISNDVLIGSFQCSNDSAANYSNSNLRTFFVHAPRKIHFARRKVVSSERSLTIQLNKREESKQFS